MAELIEWSTERPVFAGYYWLKDANRPEHSPEIVYVGMGLTLSSQDRYVNSLWSGRKTTLNQMYEDYMEAWWWWVGPLLPPAGA